VYCVVCCFLVARVSVRMYGSMCPFVYFVCLYCSLGLCIVCDGICGGFVFVYCVSRYICTCVTVCVC